MSDVPDKYYISDDIYYDFGLESFYKEKETEGENNLLIKKITNSNFKKEFIDYGWEELDFLWNIELGDKFMLLDCGSNGDCLFHCLAEALNLDNIYRGDVSNLYDVEILREKASHEILDTNFEFILQNYKIEKIENEFQGDWDPYVIDSKEQLCQELCKTGNNFWGDHIIIQLLSQSLKKNIIVLNADEDFEQLSLNRIETMGSKGNIMLYFENSCHFKLIGKFNGKKITTVFNSVPKNLLNLEN
jgi:hypothetical protein